MITRMQEVAEPTPAATAPRVGGAKRETAPAFFNPAVYGGYTILPRRGVANPGTIATAEGLKRLAMGSPLRLLSYLPELDPGVGLATWNALRLTTAPDSVQIVAVKQTASGKGGEQTDDEGTAAIEALWESLPPEIGGLNGLLSQLVMSALFTGLPCLEAVPGARMAGIGRVWPVDSLTVGFRRDPDTTEVIPLQWQMAPQVPTKIGSYVELNRDTFFWRAVDSPIDDPYGRAPYAPVIAQVLADLAMIQDLRDSVHNSAWPRTAHGFNFKEMYDVAVNVMKITDPVKAAAWVEARFAEVVAAVAALKPDDNIIYDSTGDLETIEGGKGLRNVEPILTFLRQRAVQALKSLPTLMGINDGSTQTYTTVEWQIYAAGLESIRDIVVQLLIKVANLHLRLMGSPLKAAANVQRIRTNDELVDAQAEASKIANAIKKRDEGWITDEQASIEITGSGPAGKPKLVAETGGKVVDGPPPVIDPNADPAETPAEPAKAA